jgi:radical SAM protein with 4Fe4S-binding SPASM domain
LNTLHKIQRFFKHLQPLNKDIPSVYKAYYKSREISQRLYLCHAPFNNMYFNSQGEVANCWLTFDDPEYYDETKTIRDIWFGEKFTRLREAIKDYDLSYKCTTCKNYIDSGNFVNVLARTYDNEYPIIEYPTMIEFELSNTCNLECTMCTGLLSSVIRKNREKLPALKSPYGDRFVEELREFIPHLKEVRFNGGEPFLIHIYYKIWDLIQELNPGLKIVVATNGTVLTAKVKKYLERGNFHINLSIDSLDPALYAQIRVNGDLNEVLENFHYFKNYCAERKRNFCIMVNPMRQNWEGMIDFINFCNEHHVHVWFNTIVRPYEQAIWTLPASTLQHIYNTLSSIPLNPCHQTPRGLYAYNTGIFTNFVHKQIKTWMEEAQAREQIQHVNTPGRSELELFEDSIKKLIQLQFKLESEAAAATGILNEKIHFINAYLQGKIPQELYYRKLNSVNLSAVFIFLLESSPEKITEALNHFIAQHKNQV